jgi:hypothetical protein
MVPVALSPLSSALGWRGPGLPRGGKRLHETSPGVVGTAQGHRALPARCLLFWEASYIRNRDNLNLLPEVQI